MSRLTVRGNKRNPDTGTRYRSGYGYWIKWGSVKYPGTSLPYCVGIAGEFLNAAPFWI